MKFILFFILLMKDLLADRRVSKQSKAVATVCLAYLLNPFDVVPDFIPILGYLDDYIVASILLNEILNRVDEKILLEHWRGSKGNLIFAKRVGGFFSLISLSGIKRKIFRKNQTVKLGPLRYPLLQPC